MQGGASMKNIIYVFTVIFWSYLGEVLIYVIPKSLYLELHPEWEAYKDFDELLKSGPLFLCFFIFWFIPYITLTFHFIFNERSTRLFFFILTPISILISLTGAWVLSFFS